MFIFFFFFNDTATTEIYTLSLHDALPILVRQPNFPVVVGLLLIAQFLDRGLGLLIPLQVAQLPGVSAIAAISRSEEHTSELQSLAYLVCRLLLEKKKRIQKISLSLLKYTS